MSETEAMATGLVQTTSAGSPECPSHGWVGAPREDTGGVHFATRAGGHERYVQVISAGPGVATPEGVHIGSTVAEAKAAFGDRYSRGPHVDDATVTIPGHDGVFYSLFLGESVKYGADAKIQLLDIRQGKDMLGCA